MSANTRFTVAVHGLTLLAEPGGEWTSSERIAGSVRTNPVVVRRILGGLHSAALIECACGARGGYRLARLAARITLADIYEAVREEGPLALHAHAPNPRCPVGRCIQKHLAAVYDRAEEALVRALRATTLADLKELVAEES